MRAVINEVPPELLEWRRRTGADRYDEVWDGVLHIMPVPPLCHQELLRELTYWLQAHWARSPACQVLQRPHLARPGVAAWEHDFRIPDIALVTDQSRVVDRGTHLEGGPDVVVEIAAANDETLDKLPFYASVGCGEIWVLDCESRVASVYAVVEGKATPRPPGPQGWLRSDQGIDLRAEENRLALQLTGDDGSRRLVP